MLITMQNNKVVISAHFQPSINKWTGMKVEMGVKGTHDNYNIVYNGVCNGDYFDNEIEAKQKAIDSTEPKV